MKNRLKFACLLTLGLFVLTTTSCSNNSNADSNDADYKVADNNKTASNPNAQNPDPQFEFKDVIWDFGKINEGERVRHTFKFTNVGNENLIITKCSADCGCTVPKWDKKPVAPGESGEIVVVFNSDGKHDSQIKNITITANTNPPTTILTIKSFVISNQ